MVVVLPDCWVLFLAFIATDVHQLRNMLAKSLSQYCGCFHTEGRPYAVVVEPAQLDAALTELQSAAGVHGVLVLPGMSAALATHGI